MKGIKKFDDTPNCSDCMESGMTGTMEHFQCNDTHIYICTECPNVTFEYSHSQSIRDLEILLEGNEIRNG